MQLLDTHSSGAIEWYCPTCGRRFLLQFPPKYKKIVLEAGDEYAVHSGGKDGLVIGAPQLTQSSELSEYESGCIINWEQWLGQMKYKSFWYRKI
jgi:hypothetical protein